MKEVWLIWSHSHIRMCATLSTCSDPLWTAHLLKIRYLTNGDSPTWKTFKNKIRRIRYISQRVPICYWILNTVSSRRLSLTHRTSPAKKNDHRNMKNIQKPKWFWYHMGVSENRGTPKWTVYIRKPYKNGWFGGKPTILGNIHMPPPYVSYLDHRIFNSQVTYEW